MSEHRHAEDFRGSSRNEDPKLNGENVRINEKARNGSQDADTSFWLRLKNKCSDTWLLECLSALFSAACVVALVIFLRVLENKEPPSWNNKVSPNAIVSIASTLAKAAMLLVVAEAIGQFKWLHMKREGRSLKNVQIYDDATRGPLGAVHFLWHFRRAQRVAFWVFIGCLVTVLAIAIDPLTQQILRYENRSRSLGIGSAHVSHAHTYDWGTKGISGENGGVTGLRDPGLSAAAIGALFDSPLALTPSCPSFNCTYPDFTTVGMSSTCKDVTSQTAHNCSINSLDGTQFCTFALPGHLRLGASTTYGVGDGFSHTQANATTKITAGDYNHANGALLAEVSMILFPGNAASDTAATSTAWRKTLQAWECTFELVAYAYSNVTVHNGLLRPPNIRMSPLRMVSSADNATTAFVYETIDKNWPGNGEYRLGWGDLHNFAGILGVLEYRVYEPIYIAEGTNIFINALAAGGPIPQKFNNIASSMTHHMMQSSPNATNALGEALLQQTYIAVRWPWLVPLICLVLLMWIFLALAIAFTAASELRIWKSSLYPLLTLNVHGNAANASRAEVDWRLSQMEEKCRRQESNLFSTTQKSTVNGNYTQIAQQ